MTSILAVRSPVEVMRDFDALPAQLRRRIAAAGFAYSPALISKRLAAGVPPTRIIRQIDRAEGRRAAQ